MLTFILNFHIWSLFQVPNNERTQQIANKCVCLEIPFYFCPLSTPEKPMLTCTVTKPKYIDPRSFLAPIINHFGELVRLPPGMVSFCPHSLPSPSVSPLLSSPGASLGLAIPGSQDHGWGKAAPAHAHGVNQLFAVSTSPSLPPWQQHHPMQPDSGSLDTEF